MTDLYTDQYMLLIFVFLLFIFICIIIISSIISDTSESVKVKDNNLIWREEPGEFISAISVSDKVKDRDFKNDRECGESASKWVDKGWALFPSARYEEAIGCFDKALAIDPDCIKAWYGKGELLIQSNRYGEAIECFLENANLTAGMKERIMNVIEIWIKSRGVSLDIHTPTLKQLDTVTSISNTEEVGKDRECEESAYEWVDKGWALFPSARYEEAIECFDKALAIDPDCIKAWYGKGELLIQSNRYDEAIECFLENANLTAGMKERIMNVIEIWIKSRGVSLDIHTPTLKQLDTVTSISNIEEVGKYAECPYCGSNIRETFYELGGIVRCDKCGAFHHKECFEYYGRKCGSSSCKLRNI